MRKSIFTLLLSLIIIHLLSGCREINDDDDASSFNTNTGLIGTEGGTITTASGAVIVIPPGALDSNTTITITSYDAQSNLPEYTGIMGNFIGGLVLSPDGLNCQKPVTITIPLNDTITSGMEVKLFLYDDGDADNGNYPANYSGWQQTDFTGTVSSDGKSVVAQIDHFSTIVIEFDGEFTLDILGDMVETIGNNELGVDFANYQTYFESTVEKLGDLHAHNLFGFGYECYKVVGIEYIIYFAIDGYEDTLGNFKGTEGEVAFCFNYEGDRNLVVGTDEKQIVYHLFINVHKDRTPPAINLTAARTRVQPGEQTNVTGCLSCGADKMKDQDVYFSVNSLGSINPTQKTTNNNGDATIRFTAGNEEGTAAVTGEYSAHNKDKIEVISDSVNVLISEEPTIENWSFQIVMNHDYFYTNYFELKEYSTELRATSRTLINGTFTVDFSTTESYGHTKFTGSASGEATYTIKAVGGQVGDCSWYCPEVSKTQSASFSVEGEVLDNREKIFISVSLTSDVEDLPDDTQCSTCDGPGETRRYQFKHNFFFITQYNGRDLPYKEGLTVIVDEKIAGFYRYYSLELKRN